MDNFKKGESEMRLVLKRLVGFLSLFFSVNAFGIISYCDVASNESFYHVAIMDPWEISSPWTQTFLSTNVDGTLLTGGNYSHGANDTWNAVYSAHLYVDLLPGEYEWDGSAALQIGDQGGELGEIWESIAFSFCSNSHTVLVTPPSNLSVTVNPQTVGVGDPFSITWNSRGADYCTYESQQIPPSGSTTVSAAAYSDEKTYSITCSNTQFTRGPASDYLTVKECAIDTGPAFGYPDSIAPDPQEVGLIGDGTAGGLEDVQIEVGGSGCTRVCVDYSYRYRVNGYARSSANSSVLIATQMQAPNCGAVARTPEYIEQSYGHEAIHSAATISRINASNAWFYTAPLFESQSDCLGYFYGLVAEAYSAQAVEIARQIAHDDHHGYPKPGLACYNGVTVEGDGGTY